MLPIVEYIGGEPLILRRFRAAAKMAVNRHFRPAMAVFPQKPEILVDKPRTGVRIAVSQRDCYGATPAMKSRRICFLLMVPLMSGSQSAGSRNHCAECHR